MINANHNDGHRSRDCSPVSIEVERTWLQANVEIVSGYIGIFKLPRGEVLKSIIL